MTPERVWQMKGKTLLEGGTCSNTKRHGVCVLPQKLWNSMAEAGGTSEIKEDLNCCAKELGLFSK